MKIQSFNDYLLVKSINNDLESIYEFIHNLECTDNNILLLENICYNNGLILEKSAFSRLKDSFKSKKKTNDDKTDYASDHERVLNRMEIADKKKQREDFDKEVEDKRKELAKKREDAERKSDSRDNKSNDVKKSDDFKGSKEKSDKKEDSKSTSKEGFFTRLKNRLVSFIDNISNKIKGLRKKGENLEGKEKAKNDVAILNQTKKLKLASRKVAVAKKDPALAKKIDGEIADINTKIKDKMQNISKPEDGRR